MARDISKAEAWERAHEVFTQVNFNAFDYNSIKESLLDYMKLYYPEDFNDYIESSEFIALLELFAYVGELTAYRLDLNAHENFITTAQRKESILRLAKLISYKASRNIPARGLVKIASISTTETIFDSAGRNLAGRTIIWNDANNPDWKEQFLLILNRFFEQPFGTVTPNERVQVDDVLFELYTLNNNPIGGDGRSVFAYSATTGTENYPMELVPSELTSTGPVEKRPELNGKFNFLYASDGLGDGSDTTGFMVFTKQGTLLRQEANFDGLTPNLTFDVAVNNINETDVWLNNVDPTTRTILDTDPLRDVLPHYSDNSLRYGEWVEVDLSNAQNILFNANKNRRKFEIETLNNDQIRLIFGDGEFADIPSGAFDIWYRTSANADIAIPRSAVVNKTASLTYNDPVGNVQTVTFSFSLVGSLLNASASEDIEHIRRVAPSVYYTQDRMVNGRDYNSYPLQDPTILKLRSVNRTFAGDSKYIAWHDPSESYENVKIFGDDLALYWKDTEASNGPQTTLNTAVPTETLLTNLIEPLLCSTDVFTVIAHARSVTYAPLSLPYWILLIDSPGLDSGWTLSTTQAGDNLYFSGYANNSDMSVLKVSQNGVVQWQRGLVGAGLEEARASYVDSSGNLYVVGYTNSDGWGMNDILMTKYSSTGQIQWQNTLGGPNIDSGQGIGLDSLGNIYIAGTVPTGLAPTPNDLLVAKFDNNGVFICRTITGNGLDQFGTSLVIDSAENIYVGGVSGDLAANSATAFIARLQTGNSNPVLALSATAQRAYGPVGGGNATVSALAVDSGDNLYMLGMYYDVGANDYKAMLVKFNPLFTPLWCVSVPWGTTWNRRLSLCVDSLDNPYVALQSGTASTLIAKFDQNGNVQWRNTFNAHIETIKVDATGNMYIGGSTTGLTQKILAKLPSNGTRTGNYGVYSYQPASDVFTRTTPPSLPITQLANPGFGFGISTAPGPLSFDAAALNDVVGTLTVTQINI